jgi:hypothetical protein
VVGEGNASSSCWRYSVQKPLPYLPLYHHSKEMESAHLKLFTMEQDMQAHNNFTLSLTSTLHRGQWSTPCPGHFSPGNETWYPSYRMLGGPRGVWKGMLNLFPTGLWSPDRPACSLLGAQNINSNSIESNPDFSNYSCVQNELYIPITQFLVFCSRHWYVSQYAFKNINYAY